MKLRGPRSLIGRILLSEGLIILIAGILLWQLTAGLLRRTADRIETRGLEAQASLVEQGVTLAGGDRLAVRLPLQLKPIYDTGYDGRAYALLDIAGHVLTASRFAPIDIAAEVPREPVPAPFHRGDVIGLSLPRQIAGRNIWVVVTLNEQGPGAIVDDVARAFLVGYIGILAGLLLLLPMVNGFVVRHMVRAVKRVSREASLIGNRGFDQRLDEGGLPSEVVPLVQATNGLVDRLEASLRRQSEFSANVAHELRTPLATLKAQVDALEDDALRKQIDMQIDRLSHILSQLRDLSGLEEVSTDKLASVDLVELAIGRLAEFGPKAVTSGHTLALEGDQVVTVAGNVLLIELALSNLVDNAIKHTPEGTRIVVHASKDGWISVSDDGPGVSTSHTGQVTRRFWRADWNRVDGAGLGLSIVQRIMDMHGGQIELRPSSKGAAFRLTFVPLR